MFKLEEVRKALQLDAHIRRTSWGKGVYLKLQKDGCIYIDSRCGLEMWVPTYEDLEANNWEIVDDATTIELPQLGNVWVRKSEWILMQMNTPDATNLTQCLTFQRAITLVANLGFKMARLSWPKDMYLAIGDYVEGKINSLVFFSNTYPTTILTIPWQADVDSLLANDWYVFRSNDGAKYPTIDEAPNPDLSKSSLEWVDMYAGNTNRTFDWIDMYRGDINANPEKPTNSDYAKALRALYGDEFVDNNKIIYKDEEE